MSSEFTLKSHDGDTIIGILLSHQRELPKSATLALCKYDENYIMHHIYRSFGKKGIKTFIIKCRY